MPCAAEIASTREHAAFERVQLAVKLDFAPDHCRQRNVGVEMAIADQFSVRGEAMATGSWGGGFNGGKITAGLLWHLD
jgi:hypothetical protein